jgi:hypothetical protein
VPIGPDSGEIESIESLAGLLITSIVKLFDFVPSGLTTSIERTPGGGESEGRNAALKLDELSKLVVTGC